MKTLIIIPIVYLLISLGCSQEKLCIKGSGDVKTYNLEKEAFENIKISGPISLQITQSETRKITVLAEPELYQHLTHQVEGNTLNIGFDDRKKCFETYQGVWVLVSLPEFKSIETEGQNSIISYGPIFQNSLTFNTSGQTNISISGEVKKQLLFSEGDIKVTNFNLVTEETSIDIKGSGDIEVNCTELLDIKSDGAVTVWYKGNPEIQKSSDGSFSLNQKR